MPTKLKPCPFCGANAEWDSSEKYFSLVCSNIQCKVDPYVTSNKKSTTIKMWNSIPETTRKRKKNEDEN